MIKHCGYTSYWVVSILFGVVVALYLVGPEVVLAQDTTFRSMVNIPGLTEGSDASDPTQDFDGYINALYIFAITIGALLAVLKLIAAGVKYMFSDIVTSKEDAKKDIKGALFGLLIVIGAVVILNTINTDLTDVDLSIDSADVNTNPWGDYLKQIRIRTSAFCEEHIDCKIQQCTTDIASALSQAGQTCKSRCEENLNGLYSEGFGLSSCVYSPAEQVTTACVTAGGNPEGTNCEVYDCNALGGSTWDYVKAGAGIGAAGGAVGCAPSLIGTPFCAIIGGVTGGAVGFGTKLAGDEAACQAVCSWYGGEFTYTNLYSGKNCVYPTEKSVPEVPEIAQLLEEEDVERATEKLETSTANPKTISEITSYFGVEETYFESLTVVDDAAKIANADRILISQRLGLANPAELGLKIIDGEIESLIFQKNDIPLADFETYNIMVANAETRLRSKCTDVIQVSETSRVTAESKDSIVRFYCIK